MLIVYELNDGRVLVCTKESEKSLKNKYGLWPDNDENTTYD